MSSLLDFTLILIRQDELGAYKLTIYPKFRP